MRLTRAFKAHNAYRVTGLKKPVMAVRAFFMF
jgi:hypothetical protein